VADDPINSIMDLYLEGENDILSAVCALEVIGKQQLVPSIVPVLLH
jgi:hypothetical protein